jgi:lambda family phage portal protein
MQEAKQNKSFGRRAAEFLDNAVTIVNPVAGLRRKAARFAYDAVDTSDRLNKKRTGLGGTADVQLDEHSLWRQREIIRELDRNNPLVSGILETETDGVIGDGVKIQARTLNADGKTQDTGWNAAAEWLWNDEMIDKPCDVTGRFNFNQYLWNMFYSYRRDGDMGTIYTDQGLQAFEGEQCGTPFGMKKAEHFKVVNGVAYSKLTKKVIGYYVGRPDENGFFIKSDSYQKYKAAYVQFHFNPRRFSQSRGQPALTPSIKYIDYLCGYIDAELVAAKINACFAAFITKKDAVGNNFPIMQHRSGSTEVGNGAGGVARREKIEPGIIEYLQPGEEVSGVGMTRPGSMFDPFVSRILTFIGRPLCMPLMLVTLDFSGATFMNTRIAYQKVQSKWVKEQNFTVKPFSSRTWNWKIAQWIREKKLKAKDSAFLHEVICNRWPYVDPYKEAMADEQELKNRSTTRTRINARKGQDYEDIIDETKREDDYAQQVGVELNPDKKAAPAAA